MLPTFARTVPASPPSPRALMMARLSRLLQLEEEWRRRTPSTDWRMRLIHKGIYSTYCDCLELGIGAQALGCIERSRSTERH